MTTAGGEPSGRAARGWLLFSLVGVAGWAGVTVLAAVRLDDPSDARPVLRAFALGGAVFCGALFAAAAVSIWRRARANTAEHFAALAGSGVTASAVRAAARRQATVGLASVGFGAVTTGLVLAGIGAGRDELLGELLGAALVVVLLWAGVLPLFLGRSVRAADAVLAALGLAVTGMAASRTRQELRMGGRRQGRRVEIVHRPRLAVTRVEGRFPEGTMRSPAECGRLAGGEPGSWRRVRVESGPDGIVVTRSGNGAGRHLLDDLRLAEALAGAAVPEASG